MNWEQLVELVREKAAVELGRAVAVSKLCVTEGSYFWLVRADPHIASFLKLPVAHGHFTANILIHREKWVKEGEAWLCKNDGTKVGRFFWKRTRWEYDPQ